MVLKATRQQLNFFHLAGDEHFIVYVSLSGKMECIERQTGKSRWIYVFPMFYLPSTKDYDFPGQDDQFEFALAQKFDLFFTEKIEMCEDGSSITGIKPLLVDGEPEPTQVTMFTDPDPDTGHKTDFMLAAVVAWGTPILTMVVLLLLMYFRLWSKTKKKYLVEFMVLAIIASVSLVHYYYGGYSRSAHILMRIVFWVSCFSLAYLVFEKQIRRWFAEQCQIGPNYR